MAEGTKRRWFGRRVAAGAPSDGVGALPPWGPSDDLLSAAAVSAAPSERSAPSPAQLAAMTARLTDYVHVQVRSGVYDLGQLRDLTLEAAGAEIADPADADEVARRVLSNELARWHEDADRWGVRTDCDRLDAAIELLGASGVLTLAGLLDEQSLAESLRIRAYDEGCVGYLVADIWRAIDTNSLHLTLIDPLGQPAGRHSPVSRAAIDALAAVGLLGTAGTGEGQIEVAMVWRRRPPL